jgi:protein O-mannosyl-transferase
MTALAAALFAWHPLRLESVAWVTERKDVMSGAFFLLTPLAYARYVDDRRTDRPWRRAYALTLACFVAGLVSKPMLVTLPLILLILDFWRFARSSASLASLRQLLLEKVPFFALSAAAAVVTLLMQRHEGAFVLDLPPSARAGNAVVSIARYLARFFWPVDLSVCYPHPGYWPTAVVVAAAALTVALSVFAWQTRRSRPWIAVGWLWFLVALLPVLGLVQAGFQAMADRYTSLPMLGVELALLWSLRPLWNSTRIGTLANVVVAVVVVACAARTWDQQRVWRDSVALFEHAVAVADDNDLAEDFLASALFAAGRFDEAALHAERALALNPRNATAAITLAGTRER